MSINFNPSSNSVNLSYNIPEDVNTSGANGAARTTQNLTLSLGTDGHIEILGNNGAPVLPTPQPGQNVPQALLEAAQQIEQGLAALGLKPTYQDVKDLAASFAKLSGPGGMPPTKAGLVAAAELIESKAGNLEKQLRALIENSTYPDFNDFMKELASLAQKIRESASEIKTAAINGKYDLQIAAANKQLDAAKADYDKGMKDLTVKVTEAWLSLAGAVVGASVATPGKSAEFMGSYSGAFKSIGTLATIGTAQDALQRGLDAETARADAKKMEAAGSLLDSNISAADDLRDIGKNLRDALIKCRQDMNSAHQQNLSSAGAV
ncbi:MAG: hypothetical protein WCQ89_17505 [Verrucomicrobiota bacterium]|jgi:hypothetical protein